MESKLIGAGDVKATNIKRSVYEELNRIDALKKDKVETSRQLYKKKRKKDAFAEMQEAISLDVMKRETVINAIFPLSYRKRDPSVTTKLTNYVTSVSEDSRDNVRKKLHQKEINLKHSSKTAWKSKRDQKNVIEKKKTQGLFAGLLKSPGKSVIGGLRGHGALSQKTLSTICGSSIGGSLVTDVNEYEYDVLEDLVARWQTDVDLNDVDLYYYEKYKIHADVKLPRGTKDRMSRFLMEKVKLRLKMGSETAMRHSYDTNQNDIYKREFLDVYNKERYEMVRLVGLDLLPAKIKEKKENSEFFDLVSMVCDMRTPAYNVTPNHVLRRRMRRTTLLADPRMVQSYLKPTYSNKRFQDHIWDLIENSKTIIEIGQALSDYLPIRLEQVKKNVSD